MDETTLNQVTGEEASTNEEAQTTPEQLNATEEVQSEPLEIPKKFVGKSPQEILRAYNDLERQFHKVASERADERKSKETLETKIREIEERVSKLNTSPISQASSQEVEEVDPFSDYDKAFDEDPKNAIKQTLKRQMEAAKRAQLEAELRARAAEAESFYVSQKKENPDFAKLEPKMQQIAQEYHGLVKPEMLNSVAALKLLHLAARGASVDDYIGDAVSRAKKEGQTIRQEKKQAFSESTRSAASDSVKFEELSLDEMEKLLGRAD